MTWFVFAICAAVSAVLFKKSGAKNWLIKGLIAGSLVTLAGWVVLSLLDALKGVILLVALAAFAYWAVRRIRAAASRP